MIRRPERKIVERMALQSFLESETMCKKELAVVPPCSCCGVVPAQYFRLDDGTIRCMDRGACYRRAGSGAAR